MCQLCREISQTTIYSCGHEVTRTEKVPTIFLWHKTRKKVTLRNKYGCRKLCKDCRVSAGSIKDKRKTLQRGNNDDDVPAMATGALTADENRDAGVDPDPDPAPDPAPAPAAGAGAGAGDAGDDGDAGAANPEGERNNNDTNDEGATPQPNNNQTGQEPDGERREQQV